MRQLILSLLVLVLAGWYGAASASPIQTADIVLVDGMEWAQPDRFLNLSWNDINAICPGGGCGNATLNGFDMAGWTWASVADTNALFNNYLSARGVSDADLLGALDPDVYTGTFNGLPYDPFFNDGWRATFVAITLPYSMVDGWSSNSAMGSPGSAYHPYYSWVGNSLAHTITADTSSVITADDEYFFFEAGLDPIPNNPGAWFYRDVSEVSVPGTVWLLGSVICGLGLRKHRLTKRSSPQDQRIKGSDS
jgi:hypothetical protein